MESAFSVGEGQMGQMYHPKKIFFLLILNFQINYKTKITSLLIYINDFVQNTK